VFRKKLLILAVICLVTLFITTGCSDNPEKQIADVVESFYDTMKKGDIDQALTLTKGTSGATKEEIQAAKEILTLASTMAKSIEKTVVKQVKLIDTNNATVTVELQIAGKKKDTQIKAVKEETGWKVDFTGK